MSKTRERFQRLRKERQAARKQAAYDAAHRFWCQGQRRRHGKLRQCMHEVRFRVAADGVAGTCRKCGQGHRHYGGKWFTVENYELERYKREKQEASDHESEVGYHPYYMPWETAVHDPDCGHKGVDLLGLRRTQRTMLAGPGVTRLATAMVDRENKVQHWCRPAKA